MKLIKNIVFKMLNQILKLSANKNSLKFLGIISTIESIFFPIPPDLFLIPIAMTKKYKWLFLGLFTTITSVIGGVIGYLIGVFFWDIIGSYIISFYNSEDEINSLKILFQEHGWMIILVAGLTPVPYKIFTISSGFLSLNIFVFIICSILSRGLRFISIAYLISKYGERGVKFLEKHFNKLSVLVLIVLIGIGYVFLFHK